jgi:uncharacterized RDD family membrane protein YckC
MESRTKLVPIKRVFAFLFDLVFGALLTFSLYIILGLIMNLESDIYQKLIYLFLVLIFLFLFFGEIFFNNTPGKYLFGLEIIYPAGNGKPSIMSLIKRGILKIFFPVEVFVLFISKSKQRLGDLWAGTAVVNSENNKLKPYVRALIGVGTLILFYFIFSMLVGLSVRRTDFYSTGVKFLKENKSYVATGLPTEVLLDKNKVEFGLPVKGPDDRNYAKIGLEKTDGQWHVTSAEFFNGHIGVSFGINLP